MAVACVVVFSARCFFLPEVFFCRRVFSPRGFICQTFFSARGFFLPEVFSPCDPSMTINVRGVRNGSGVHEFCSLPHSFNIYPSSMMFPLIKDVDKANHHGRWEEVEKMRQGAKFTDPAPSTNSRQLLIKHPSTYSSKTLLLRSVWQQEKKRKGRLS